MSLPSYAIVTPVKDEAPRLRLTAESVLAQTHRPTRWVIVDDGSGDGTRELVQELVRGCHWIAAVDSGDDGERARGGRIVRAFERGRTELREHHDFVVKLDGDITLPADYFERVAATFELDARAGIVGGRLLVHDGRGWVHDRLGRHTVNGATKAYRVTCLEDIGGLRPSMGWDGIDEYAAKARGWKVIPLDDLQVLHHAARGSKQRWWRARVEEGRGARYMGYRGDFLLARAGYRMLVERPPFVGGLGLLTGWLAATVARAPVVDDAAAVAALRAEQRDRLRRLWSGATIEPDRPTASPFSPRQSARGSDVPSACGELPTPPPAR
jgi:poly-beta-1,6-N-acetyl-D-glucosamine synthase